MQIVRVTADGLKFIQKGGYQIDILKEWERDPPEEDLRTMTGLWYDFKRRRRDPVSPICRFRDDIPEVCAILPTSEQALRFAVRSIRPNGKMHNHQSKVSRALPAYEEKLMKHLGAFQKVDTFGSLHALLDLLRTPGIGPMTVYDVSVRYGAWLGLKPELIYIHAGTAAGLKALGISTLGWGESIPMDVLPAILRNKDPDEVEDFLCTYRMAFELIRRA